MLGGRRSWGGTASYTSDRQQPVDFGIWQAGDGTWQLWSCIRNTRCPGAYTQRLLHGWEGASLEDSDWQPKGVMWLAKPELGEIEGGMQAPHVIRERETSGPRQGFGREVLRGVAKEAGVTLKWAAGGAVSGAGLIGGIGLAMFGFTGLGIGALVGAVVGGVGAVLLYTTGTSLMG